MNNRKEPAMVYVIQDILSGDSDIVAEGVKIALLRAFADLGIEFQFVPRLFIHTLKVHRSMTHIVALSIESLREAKKRFKTQPNVFYHLIECPTSYPDVEGSPDTHFKDLKQVLSHQDCVITDSDLSRALLEKLLVDYRADVRVIVPDLEDASKRNLTWSTSSSLDAVSRTCALPTDCWTFGGSKSNHGIELNAPGLTWSRDAMVPVPEESNCDSLEEILEDTFDPDNHERNLKVASSAFRGRLFEERPLSIGILGNKLTFIDELAVSIARASGSRVVLDPWKYLSAPSDPKRSKSVIDTSDVVIGEWARPSNCWIQQHASEDKRLIVRAHRYEVTTDFPSKIDTDRIDSAVVIVPWVGRTLVQKFGWPSEKMVYIPNFINRDYFLRQKLPGSEFTLGIVGITPHLKRIDLALDLLCELRAVDPRFVLRVRGGDPRKHPHWSESAEMRAQWYSVMTRLRQDPLLRGAVHFDAEGRDMAQWFEQIGVILSTSDLEGSHVALAEGLASGALGVARRWPGVDGLWPEDVIFDELEDAKDHILAQRDPRKRAELTSKLQSLASLDPERNLRAWWDLLNGRVEQAQKYFGPVDWLAPIHQPIDDSELYRSI